MKSQTGYLDVVGMRHMFKFSFYWFKWNWCRNVRHFHFVIDVLLTNTQSTSQSKQLTRFCSWRFILNGIMFHMAWTCRIGTHFSQWTLTLLNQYWHISLSISAWCIEFDRTVHTQIIREDWKREREIVLNINKILLILYSRSIRWLSYVCLRRLFTFFARLLQAIWFHFV